MKNIAFSNINITGGFWKTKQDMVKNTTVKAVYDRFVETHRFSALDCSWRISDGEEKKPHIFYDSDVAKWLEGASYILMKESRPDLEKIIDEAVDKIVSNADKNGYFNSHFLAIRPAEKFTDRGQHELYCLGHLIEAAIAYNNATGKDKFLKAMCKYADYVYRVFVQEEAADFTTPGHPELELALVKLYEATGEKKYLDLAYFFVDKHGMQGEVPDKKRPFFVIKYNMDEMPLRERKTIDGHSVRALYLFTGVADVARHTKEMSLIDVCKRMFDNCTEKRMYITGGVGSTYLGEAFTVDYHLPPRRAYTETCASIALIYFASRMQLLEENSKYADIIEKVIYNGLLSGISLDGKAFFYENPLEIDIDFNDVNHATSEKERFPCVQRQEVFSCSCCPPNMVRFIPSVADYIYTLGENTLYVNQFMESDGEFEGIKISQKTGYPCDGNVKIKVENLTKVLAVRIPCWCKSFTIDRKYTLRNGYALIENAEGEINVCFDMPVTFMRANRRVHDVAGRVSLTRGPVVYCLEGVDNGKDLQNVRIDRRTEFCVSDSEFLLPSVTGFGFRDKENGSLYFEADEEFEKIPLKFIPYYAFANRGVSEMQVWVRD